MTPLLFYFLKQLAIAGLCYAYYGLVLRDKARHQYNRWFLGGSVLAAILLPLVPVHGSATPDGVLTLPMTVPTYLLPAVQVGSRPGTINTPLWCLETCYAGITLLLLLRVGYNCWQLWQLRRQSQVSRNEDVILALHKNVGLPFSFFNVIFWNTGMPTGSDAGMQILQHEMVHVRQYHSLDKLLLELICSCCWINPFFYLYRREMAVVHEFLADEGAAQDKAHYAATILHTAFQPSWALTNNFFHPPIQRRIQMLLSKPSKISCMKKLALFPLGLALAAVISCQQQNDISPSTEIPPSTPPIHLAGMMKDISWEDLKKISVNNIESIEVLPHDSTIFSMKDGTQYVCIHPNEKNQFKLGLSHSTLDAGVYTFVDNPPTFKGGEAALNKFLSASIKYPQAAHQERRSGLVVVQFVISPDGIVTKANAISAPYADLADEALRVVNQMPAWNPGTQQGKRVAVQFNLPIRFSLE